MNLKSVSKALKRNSVTPTFAACLFCGSSFFLFNGFLGPLLQDLWAPARDPQLQWLIALCICFYLTTFTLIQSNQSAGRFLRLDNPTFWLTAILLVGAFVYAFHYPTASQSTQALTFLSGAAMGKGASSWSASQNRREHAASFILYVFMLLLLIASLWHTGINRSFEYRNQPRWAGPWDNPNIFGLLMGAGATIAIGLAANKWQTGDAKGETGKGLKPAVKEFSKWIVILGSMLAASFMAYGLWRSYSRGAWLGTLCGLIYLAIQRFNARSTGLVRTPKTEGQLSQAKASKANGKKLKASTSFGLCCLGSERNWFLVVVILLSIVVLSFFQFRHSEQNVFAHRVFSVANANDFSWRNRVKAWEDALQIMAENPWLGAGWMRPRTLDDYYYLPPKSDASGAIEMNDFFMLAAALGIPALFCFGMYVWLNLGDESWKMGGRKQQQARRGRKAEIGSQDLDFDLRPPTSDLLSMTCRAGAIVLLAGFWFDGGLFKMTTASMFWILLELGRADFIQPKPTEETTVDIQKSIFDC